MNHLCEALIFQCGGARQLPLVEVDASTIFSSKVKLFLHNNVLEQL